VMYSLVSLLSALRMIWCFPAKKFTDFGLFPYCFFPPQKSHS
jgi:hypothetical protein